MIISMSRFDSPMKRVGVIFLASILFRIVNVIYDALVGPFNQHSIPSSLEASNFALFIDIVIIGSIYEEFTYRFSIFQSEYRKWAFSFSCFASYICILVWWKQMHLDNLLIRDLIKILGAGLIFAVLMPIFSRLNTHFFDKIKSSWTTVYISSIIFACFHIRVPLSSFSILTEQSLYILPMFFLGLILCLIRIRFGFLYAIIFHVLYNLPSGLAFILL